MGYGDPYHEHPLKYLYGPKYLDAICSRCELPIPAAELCFGCTRCDHFIHKICAILPKMMLHPLHDLHHLTLLEPSPSSHFSQIPSSSKSVVNTFTALCNECHSPSLGFTYHCQTCQIFLHLKCAFTLKHAKHEHPLRFDFRIGGDCNICGYSIVTLDFSCTNCKFFIHPECTHMPQTFTHRHVHELTFHYNFPEECEQVYCDLCEDENGEMDRALSYYYCKKCDYIAHVCCVLQLREDVVLFENFSHEHPLGFAFGTNNPSGICQACGEEVGYCRYYCCNNCEHVAHEWCTQFPSSIKHPRHQEHTLTLDRDSRFFKCTDCEFNLDLSEALSFSHPLINGNLKFGISESMFRCNACGELGIGSRMFQEEEDFDLHLECFALPGELAPDRHSCHHPLHLLSEVPPSKSYINCDICRKETIPELWIYCCKECALVAHINCVASDWLSTLRSSLINQPDFCHIFHYDEKLFKELSTPSKPLIGETICWSLLKHQKRSFLELIGPLFSSFDLVGEWLEYDEKEEDNFPKVKNCFKKLNTEVICPKCKQLISTQAYTCIEGSSSNDDCSGLENKVSVSGFVDGQTNTFIEQLLDDTYCSICNVLIFPPIYSCATCQVFVHKFCANLAREYTFGEHTYELVAPPFDNDLNNCAYCEHSIMGYAYLCKPCGIILDLQCAVGTPFINHRNRMLACFRKTKLFKDCIACGNIIKEGTLGFNNYRRSMFLHIECALLPLILKHRIHQHPLELAEDLLQYRDEFVCDVCEKDLNPLLWGYRCLDSCKGYATSHVTCLISSKKKCHFVYDEECQAPIFEELKKKREMRGIWRLSDK